MADDTRHLPPLNDEEILVAHQRRKAHIHNREWWQALQKSCNKDTRELARYASDEVKVHLQLERAIVWVISYSQGTAPAYTPGGWLPDSLILQLMPLELAEKIKHEHACATYGIQAQVP